MNYWGRFWIGGAGALLPLLVTLLAVDLAGIIDHVRDYSVGTYVGTGLRYCVLFSLGGIVAALNSDVVQPIKLVQLGIAAPALISSYVNAQPPKQSQTLAPITQSRQISFDFISGAYAMDAGRNSGAPILVAGFFEDVYKSATSPLPTFVSPDKARNEAAIQASRNAAIEQAIKDARSSAAQAEAAAKNAAAEASRLDQSSPEAISAVQKAADAQAAANAAATVVKSLEEYTKIKAAQ